MNNFCILHGSVAKQLLRQQTFGDDDFTSRSSRFITAQVSKRTTAKCRERSIQKKTLTFCLHLEMNIV